MKEKYNINQTTLKILGLYTDNYGKALHLREVSRQTHTDVKAVGIQLKRLEDANILKSTTRGKNKEHRLNLDNPATRLHMILAETYATIRLLDADYPVKRLAAEAAPNIDGAVILFGSHARGQATHDSDIDLLIVAEDGAGAEAAAQAGRLMGAEVHATTTSRSRLLEGLRDNDPLINEAVSSHIAIKGIELLVDTLWRHHGERRNAP